MSLALVVSGAATLLLYTLARDYLTRAIESKAMSIAATTAAAVDGDAHAAVVRNGDEAARGAIERELAEVRAANRREDVLVEYVYTAVPRPDRPDRFMAVATAGPETVGRTHPAGNLAEADRVRLGATGVEEFKTDDYGTWVSGYAPVRDGNGRPVALLVVDVAATQMMARARLLLWSGGAAMAVALLLSIGLTVPLSRLVTRRLDALAAAVGRVSGGDLEARAEVRTGDEFEAVADAFNAMVPRLREHLRLRHSVQLAQEVQRNLLPRKWPRVASFEISGTSLYCEEIGGDYYDVFDLSRGEAVRLGIVVADVTGHGVPAALLMATTRAMLRARAAERDAPSAMVTDVNAAICRDHFSERFVTLFFLVIDTEDCSLRWVSAGHEPAILYDPPTDTFEELGGHGVPLGVSADWEYRESSRTGWRAGQVLLIGTDGIWETRDGAGRVFGRDALRELVRKHASEPAEGIQAAIVEALRVFRGDRAQGDDVTIVVLKA